MHTNSCEEIHPHVQLYMCVRVVIVVIGIGDGAEGEGSAPWPEFRCSALAAVEGILNLGKDTCFQLQHVPRDRT